MHSKNYTIGVDFGTDSVRAILVDASNGDELATSVFDYPRWKAGLYCDPQRNQFRQHPQDYIDGLVHTIADCVTQVGQEIRNNVRAISITTTGSTPVVVNEMGVPLALLEDFKDNPNAMFLLWKDHSAMEESHQINKAAAIWNQCDYLKYMGGAYSPEWFWAKFLYVLRHDENIRRQCYTCVEHSDWMPFLLTGRKHIVQLERNVCAAGHKAMWAQQHGGFPSAAFFKTVDPLLEPFAERMHHAVVAADQWAGNISESWAVRLGLSTSVKIGIGAIDAHVGAIGAQIKPGFLAKVIGTSTCDILVVPKDEFQDRFIKGICGQVDGSVLPDMIGLEAGQAAFGDVFAWFKNILLWPLLNAELDKDDSALVEKISDQVFQILEEKATSRQAQSFDSCLAVDWFNGRRSPDANAELKGAITQLSLASNAPEIYAALVESTCFGARAIVERFREEGLAIQGIIGVGGIARKSKYVMQVLADVLNMPIRVNRAEQVCARGAAMLAATVAGCYPDITNAMDAMGAGFDITYSPRKERAEILDVKYRLYKQTSAMLEQGLKYK